MCVYILFMCVYLCLIVHWPHIAGDGKSVAIKYATEQVLSTWG